MGSIGQFVRFARSRIGSGGKGSLGVLFSGQGATGYNELRAIPTQLRELLRSSFSEYGRPETVGEDGVPCPAQEEHDSVLAGLDWMQELIAKHGESTMRDTRMVQPVQFTFSMAIAHALRQGRAVDVASKKPRIPVSVALGHSLGEYSALAFTNAFSFAEGKQLVEARGELMSTALADFSRTREGSNPWAMVGMMRKKTGSLDGPMLEQDVQQIIDELKADPSSAVSVGTCKIATINSPFQLTVSGGGDEVDEVVRHCKERRVISRARSLPVAAPFHCDIMRPAQEKFAEVLKETPLSASVDAPVIANLSAQEYSADVDAARALLSEQITGTVRWHDSVQRAVQEHGVQAFLEITMGKPILSPLLEQSMPTAVTCCLSTPEDVMEFIAAANQED
mmetsp:Transcript_11196/g.45554  ORF Transcript_11196/g.45554 Transcript_11196/m.45554 type:complete len:394 (-) Transcript_11196:1354-2535(-)